MENITISSTHGTFTVDRKTEKIISLDCPDLNDPENDLPNITDFDFQEWKEYYKKPIPDSLDILDLGYHYKAHRGESVIIEYEEPAHDWRLEMEYFNSQPNGY